MNLTKLKAMAEFDGHKTSFEAFQANYPGNRLNEESFFQGARYQHTKDKALNELLMRIVERQSDSLEQLLNRCKNVSEWWIIRNADNDVEKLIEEFKP